MIITWRNQRCASTVAQWALTGLACKTMNVESFFFHFLTASYKSEITESEDKLAVKRGSSALSPCHNYLLSKNAITSNDLLRKWTLEPSHELLKDWGVAFLPLKKTSIQIYGSHTTHAKTSRFSVPASPFVFRYFFRFEPKHSLLSEISKCSNSVQSRIYLTTCKFQRPSISSLPPQTCPSYLTSGFGVVN